MIRLSALRIAGLCALTSLVACGETAEVSSPEVESETPLALQELDAGTNRLLMAEFAGSFDANTGEFTLSMAPLEEWAHRFPDAAELTTVRQALWCEQRPNAQQRLNTVAGSVGTTLDECGIPANSITLGLGAFCADVQLSALVDLTRPMAQITDITSGYEGYTYFESAGLIGVNPSTLGGPNPPSVLLGLFGWADTLNGETARTTWAFHNAGGSFTFAGEVWAEATEACDSIDNDCDGEIDEGAGCVSEGGECLEHADCDTGNCDGGFCGGTTCDNLVLDGSETDIDCGGTCVGCVDGLVCGTDEDCASGNCFVSTCVANRYPEPGEIVISEFMADGSASGSGNVDQEWIEFFNRSAEDLRLDGCELRDTANGHVIALPLLIPADGYVVLAEEDDGSVGAPDYEWSGFGLNNGGDDIVLNCPVDGATQTLIDEISYASLLADDQISGQLHNGQLTAAGNNVTANFCLGTDEYAPGYFGTPGAANNSCDITVDSCTFERPVLTSVPAAGSVTFYGRVAAAGVTDLTTGTDVNAANGRFGGQIGYGPLGSDPSTSGAWLWTEMTGSSTWNDATAPGQDEYDGTLTAPTTEGESYTVAARFTGNNGGDYTNCAGSGQLDIIEPALPPAAVGDLLITEFMPDPGSTQDGEWFEIYNTTGSPVELQGCTITGRFDSSVIGSSVIIAAGDYAVFSNNGDTAANYGLPVDHVWTGSYGLGNSGDDIGMDCDIDAVSTTIDAVSYGGSDDADSVSNQLDPAYFDDLENDTIDVFCKSTGTYGADGNLGTPGAANPSCFAIGFCRLQFPTDYTDTSVAADIDVFARLYVAGTTDSSTFNNPQGLIVGEVGYGNDGTDPNTDVTWIWTAAAPNSSYGGDEANNDEYVATMAGPAADGPYDVAYRFSGDGGISWTYCDLDAGVGSDGSEDGYTAANAGDLTLADTLSVGWCQLSNGENVNDVTGDSFTYYGQLFIAGHTLNAGSQNDANQMAEFGFGPDANNPTATPGDWTWASAGYDTQVGNNDQYAYTLTIPDLTTPSLDTAFRFSGDGGANWTYCDGGSGLTDGFNAPGNLTVDAWTVSSYCSLHSPASPTAAPTATQAFYGRVWAWHDANGSSGYDAGGSEDGTSRTTGGVFDNLPNLVAEFGYGTDGTNPTSDASWIFASATGEDQGLDIHANDDEFAYTLSVPANGTYDTAFRVSGDNGANWTYCGAGGVYPGSPVGSLVSAGSAPIGNQLYFEPFTGQDGQGNVDGVQDTSEVEWTLSAPSEPIDTSGPDYCEVVSGEFQTKDFGPCQWDSPIIDISLALSADIAIELAEVGNHESTDCQMVSYSVDGGVYTLIEDFGGAGSASCTVYDDFGTVTITATEIVGDTLQIRVTTANNSNSEFINMDSVTVTAGAEVTTPTGPVATVTLPYTEEFTSQTGKGVTGSGSGVTEDLSGVTWTVDHSGATLSATSDYCRVVSNQFRVRDSDGPCAWLSPVVDVSEVAAIVWGGKVSESGTHEASDYVDVSISLDGGAFVTVPNWSGLGNGSHTLIDDFGSDVLVSTFADVSAATVAQIRVTMSNNAGTEILYLDDVVMAGL